MPAAPAKKQPKKDNTKKRVALPADVRTLWAKATPSQAHQPETRPDDYEPGDSDFEDASLASALSAKKSANPHESVCLYLSDGFSYHGDFGVTARLPDAALSNQLLDRQENAPQNDGFTYSNPLVHITHAHDMNQLPGNLTPSGLSVKDGNCCPDSIIIAHPESNTTHRLLRAAVITFIRSNQQHFAADIRMAYGCSVDQYLTNMSANGEFGEAIFVMGACLVLGVSITIFTANLHNNASSITAQTFSPICPTIKNIQIHLDTGDSHLVPIIDPHTGFQILDPQTGLPTTETIVTRQPHYDTLVEIGRRDSGVDLLEDMKRKLLSPDNEQSDLPIQIGLHQPLPSPPPPLPQQPPLPANQPPPSPPPPPIVPVVVPPAPLRSTTIRPLATKVPEKLQFNHRRMFTGPKKGQSVKTFAVHKHHRSTNKTRWLLHCSQLNKFMPLESFELIDAVSGHRGTVSSFGQDEIIAPKSHNTVTPLLPTFHVSAKRGTGVCARGMCPDDVVEGKNLCALHQKKLDDRNQDARVREQTDVSSFIYRAADNLAGRANHEKSTDECIDFLLNVALNGQVNGSDVICQRNKSEREEAYKELSAGNGANCYHCGCDKLAWLSACGPNQGTPDRLRQGNYFSQEQITVSSCLFCQRLFNEMSEAERDQYLALLITKHDFHRADNAVECCLKLKTDEEAKEFGIQRLHEHRKSRESYTNSKSKMAKRSGKYKVLNDIRDYSLSEMTEVCRLFDNCCLVSGIGVEYAALSVDRYTRESHYEKNTISILLTRINDAKESDPLFFSDENLNSYMANNNIDHPLTVIVTRLREPLTRLIEFQKKKRLDTSIIVIED
ncbi:hypothetical protein BJ741DRAFT_694244 [Chytriomyces cf. hyalinus JEL632]|nr:hypothetical protein BJ741DRAFT_694244 [Chytriomyces cf. hyalinus JEL632]